MQPVIFIAVAGTPEQVWAAEAIFRNSDGYAQLGPGVWLVATDASPVAWRDFLSERVPDLQVCAVAVTETWAAAGFGAAASWLGATQRDAWRITDARA